MSVNNIQDKINIVDICDDKIFDFNLTPTVGYQIEGVEKDLLSSESSQQFTQAIKNYINSVPEKTELQFVVNKKMNANRKIERFEASIGNVSDRANDILKDQTNGYKRSELSSISTHLFIKNYASFDIPNRLFSFRFRPINVKKISNQSKKTLKLIKDIQDRQFKNSGITFTPLKTNDLFKYCFEHLNHSRSQHHIPEGLRLKKKDYDPVDFAKKGFLDVYSVRDQLILSPAYNESNYIHIHNQYYQTINIEFLPHMADDLILEELMYKIPDEYSMTITINVPDQLDIVSRLKSNRKMARLTGFDLFKSGDEGMSEYETETLVSELTDAIFKASEKNEKLFELSISILIKETDKQKLDERSAYICKIIQGIHNAEAIVDNHNHLDNFFSYLPGQGFMNQRRHIVFTSAITYFMPLSGSYTGVKEQQILLKNTKNELLSLSFKNNGLPSSHVLVIAPTGKGKSVTVNYLLKGIIAKDENDFVTIIDKGGSYIKVCSAFDGTYLSIDLDEKYALNIFPKKSDIKKENGEIDDEQKVYIRKIITMMINGSSANVKLDENQENIIEKSITTLYERVGENDVPLLIDFQNEFNSYKCDDEDDRQFIQRSTKNLKLFTDDTAPFSKLFNRHSQLDLSNNFIVFDITKLKNYERLQRIYMFIISNCVSLRMLKGNKRQHVIYDEVAELLQHPDSARLIEDQYRTARKYGNNIWCISQELDDFIGENVDAIRQNSQIKFILQLDGGFQKLESFGFNDNEVERVKKISFGEVFVKYGSIHSTVIKVDLTPLEKVLCSTDFESLQSFSDVKSSSFDKIKSFAEKSV